MGFPIVDLLLFTYKENKPLFKKTSSLLVLGIGIFLIGRFLWMMPKFDPGQKAPDFSVPGLYGDSLHLSDYQGNYLLLDFWGSWCGPCRAENPDLVQLYNKFHPRGLNVLSIALDARRERWLGAVKRDDLHWSDHGSNLKRMKDPVAGLYGVREIPTKYLIDPKGYIIATNPSFAELTTKLEEVLTK